MEKIKSRKLWAAVAGAALASLGAQIGLQPDLVNAIVNIVIAYIAGQGIVDAANALKK